MSAPVIIFDLDGTLVDTLSDLQAAVNAMLAERGQLPLPPDEVAAMVGDGTTMLVERALAARGLGDAPLAPALDRFLALYGAAPTRSSRPFPGVPEVLARLAAEGMRLAVCTNKPSHLTASVLRDLWLDGFFAAVLGGDSLPERKPHPAPLRAILARLDGETGAAAMVGDHRNDMLAAEAAGIPAVFARYGYGGATLGGFEPAAAIDRFDELPRALALILSATRRDGR
jgi:phosphoglycolate phosphatase